MAYSNYNFLIFPPDSVCIANGNGPYSSFDPHTCPITTEMVSFLNITGYNNYLAAYCLSPPSDNGCPFGFCPNSDIGAPLVRISAYISNLGFAILIFYDPDNLNASMYSLVFNVYSLLITCSISIILKKLTRIHAIIAVTTAGSPISLCTAVYAVRSIWDEGHRMKTVFNTPVRLYSGHEDTIGPPKSRYAFLQERLYIIRRAAVVIALGIWIGLAIYILLPNHMSYFTQADCEATWQPIVFKDFFLLPFIVMRRVLSISGIVMVGLPIALTLLSWIIAIWRSRLDIWRDQTFISGCLKIWSTVSKKYGFLHFISVVFIPFAYWLILVETAVLVSNDVIWKVSFGQVMAMFVMLPLVFQVATLMPECGHWFWNLRWIRLISNRKPRSTINKPSSYPDILSVERPFYQLAGFKTGSSRYDSITEFIGVRQGTG